jgi:NTP pyrophosphatase (non-canonical NTP hydrolase)
MKVMKMPREQVQWFAEQMEKKLQENDRKGGWEGCNLHWLIERIEIETKELRTAVNLYMSLRDPKEKINIIKEAADIANFAMMIADIVRKYSKD